MDVYTVSLKGMRNQNEDKHDIILNLSNKDPTKADVNYFGIYDGHGGKFVSKFLAKNLSNVFMDKRIRYPLSNKYVTNIYEHLQGVLRDQHLEMASQCGSTSLVMIHFKKDNMDYLNVINVGDSRCVLCRDNVAIALMKDHKPNWPEEKARIMKLGGEIKQDRNGGDWRIKDLSVSRAFGDIVAEPFLTNNPDIFRYRLDKTDKFVIMACDGLWDVMSNQDAVNFVLSECYEELTLVERKNKHVNIARKLAEYAIQKGSTDNVTIVILFLK